MTGKYGSEIRPAFWLNFLFLLMPVWGAVTLFSKPKDRPLIGGYNVSLSWRGVWCWFGEAPTHPLFAHSINSGCNTAQSSWKGRRAWTLTKGSQMKRLLFRGCCEMQNLVSALLQRSPRNHKGRVPVYCICQKTPGCIDAENWEVL